MHGQLIRRTADHSLVQTVEFLPGDGLLLGFPVEDRVGEKIPQEDHVLHFPVAQVQFLESQKFIVDELLHQLLIMDRLLFQGLEPLPDTQVPQTDVLGGDQGVLVK